MMNKYTILHLCLFVSTVAGVIFGLFHYEYLIWQTIPAKPYAVSIAQPTYQEATISYQKDGSWINEKVSVNVDNLEDACFSLIQEWVKTLQSEHLTPHYVTLDSTLIDVNKKNIYISFKKSLFYTQQSTYQKLLLLVSLSKTIASLESSLQQYMLLVNDAPLIDQLIDCKEPFDINYLATLY